MEPPNSWMGWLGGLNLYRLCCGKRRVGPEHNSPVVKQTSNEPAGPPPPDEDFPIFPPLPPTALLRDPAQSWAMIEARKYAAPRGEFEDTSLYALYRLYEYIVLDKRFAYRNMLKWLWRQHQWAICDIPDPRDNDPARYAFLAGVTFLVVRSFNGRVKLGLTRGARPILTEDEIEEGRNRPEGERKYEKVPPWAEHAPALQEPLSVPTEDGEELEGREDKRADPDFLAKNILLWTPHVHFT